MGTAAIQGDLWGQAPQDWATLQEPMHRPLWEAMLDAALVRSGKRILDAGCGGGGASVLACLNKHTIDLYPFCCFLFWTNATYFLVHKNG